MSGQWPPEWEDPDDGLPDEHSDAGHSELELSEVTSFLAALHSPALPASFEARISAAIAAEAAARPATEPGAAAGPAGPLTAAAGAVDAKDTDRSDNPEEFSAAATPGGRTTPAGRGPRRSSRASRRAAAASRPGGSRPGAGRRRLRMPSMQAASWTLVCVLVLAGFGFLVSRGVGSSASSSYEGATASSASAPAAGDAPQPASGTGPQSPEPAFAGQDSGTGFLVHATGTAYQQSGLTSQVRGQLANFAPSATTPASSAGASFPSASASASAASSSVAGGAKPSAALSGCVSRLTGGVVPSLVDKATYDGTPAYIIAVPTEVWVVRRGCTAADTQLITRESLNG